jgi:branched-chain amino acid transport system substrate-binding protein
MRKTWLRYLALLAVIAMLAAACGDDEGGATDEETEPTTEESDAPSEEPSDEPSEDETEDTAAEPNEGDGTLTIGTILPQTGSLAFLGPPEIAGAELAVQEINEAGGVLGTDVVLIQGDSGDTTTDLANQTVDTQLSQGVDAIIGAASSSVSLTVIDKITGNGVVQFSPANTAPDFTDYDDNGLYFRTAPSDVLQGQVVADTIIADGNQVVSIMALQDPYGEGLARFITENLEAGGATVEPEPIIYDPQAQNFSAEVQQIAAANPDAIVVIGFDESAKVITELTEAGLGPSDKAVYGTDGNMGNALGDQFEGQPGALEGMRGTTPLTDLSSDFTDRLLEVDPALQDFNYGGETYDAIIITALAAEVAGSDAGTAIGEEIPGVTKDGETCTDFAACKELVEAGTDIDYDGVTGPIELSDAGDPQSASFAILEFGPDNQLLEDPEFVLAEAAEAEG